MLQVPQAHRPIEPQHGARLRILVLAAQPLHGEGWRSAIVGTLNRVRRQGRGRCCFLQAPAQLNRTLLQPHPVLLQQHIHLSPLPLQIAHLCILLLHMPLQQGHLGLQESFPACSRMASAVCPTAVLAQTIVTAGPGASPRGPGVSLPALAISTGGRGRRGGCRQLPELTASG